MTSKEKIHQLHLSEYTTRFADQKASGLTVKQWCEQNGFTIHTYNYWKHILKEEVVNKALPDIVPLTIPEATPSLPVAQTPASVLTNRPIRATATLTTATLLLGDISIQFDSNISEDFLRTIIKAVRYA